jgi:hypothetical protein
MIRINTLAAVALAACCLAGSAVALEEKRFGETPYITGGVGEDELAEIKDRASQYTLTVMTARKGSGDFLADARVTVTRGNATLLDVIMDGPYLLVRLAPGSYRVRVEFQDRTQERQVTIGSRGGMTTTNFYWD